jgi:RNA polymerase sigma factor (sigma-70 family)
MDGPDLNALQKSISASLRKLGTPPLNRTLYHKSHMTNPDLQLQRDRFPETRWTLLARLRDPAAREDAMEMLCRDYWQPIYAYFTHRAGPEKAEDLTQDFMLVVVRKDLFAAAVEERGKLRAWLLGCLQNFWINHLRDSNRLARGGGKQFFSLEAAGFTEEVQAIADAVSSPEEAFDRAWVLSVVNTTVASLKQQYTVHGRGQTFELLSPFIMDHTGRREHYQGIASKLGVTVSNVRVQLHRLRKRFQIELQEQLLLTLGGKGSPQAELDYLLGLFAKKSAA